MEAPHEFFLRFLTCLWSLNKAVDIARSWRPTDAEVMSQLIVSLPSHVRDECYKYIPNLKTGTLDEYRARISQIWAYTLWPESGNCSTPRTTARGRAANPYSPVNDPDRVTRFGSCNKPCWQTTPVIPTNPRGPARGRGRGPAPHIVESARRRTVALIDHRWAMAVTRRGGKRGCGRAGGG
jgi:hypothetical protein